MTDQEIPEGFRKERWVFLGEIDAKGKRAASFRDQNSVNWTVAWKREHGTLAAGYIYEVLASDTSVRGGYAWTGERADDVDEIRMQNRWREQMRETERMQDKARKGDPDLDHVLDVVGEYAARFTKTTSRDALVSLLTRQVYRAQRRS